MWIFFLYLFNKWFNKNINNMIYNGAKMILYHPEWHVQHERKIYLDLIGFVLL